MCRKYVAQEKLLVSLRIKVLTVKMLKHFFNISRNVHKDTISQLTESII
jgi:hypothetical protein